MRQHTRGVAPHYVAGEVFGCALNDTSVGTRQELRAAAGRYMDTEAAAAEVAELAALLHA
jgi:hypothetical protein